jgi:hypothetical protein
MALARFVHERDLPMTPGLAVLWVSKVRVVVAVLVTALALAAVVLAILAGPLPDLVGIALTAPGLVFIVVWGQWVRQTRHASADPAGHSTAGHPRPPESGRRAAS